MEEGRTGQVFRGPRRDWKQKAETLTDSMSAGHTLQRAPRSLPLSYPPSKFICANDLDCFHMSMHTINIKSYLLQRGHRFVHLYPYT